MKWLVVLLLAAAVHANTIDSAAINPQEVWLGDGITITAVCTGPDAVNRMYADITGPSIILPSLDMNSAGDGAFILSIPGNYFDRKGAYTATIRCVTNSSTENATAGFQISELASTITSAPSYVYEGDTIEAVFVPKKNDATITSDITFAVSLDGVPASLIMPAIYDTSKGWILRVTAPAPKTYSLAASFSHQNKTVQSSASVEVRKPVEFSISADKTSLRPYDNVTLNIRAMKKGAMMGTDGLVVRVNGASVQIKSVTQNGNTYDAKITVPDMSPGRYQLVADVVNNGTTYSSTIDVSYVSILSGKIFDGTSRNMQIRLSKSGSDILSISTLSDGSYSGQVVPDNYDITIEFNDATIKLENARITALDNPINYTYTPGGVEGFATTGVYNIKIPWSFDRANVKLKYDPSYFEDSNISVFKCISWSGKCSDWVRITPEINTGGRFVTFTTSDLSTFVVGTQSQIKLSMNFDKKKYARKDVVSLKGSAFSGSEPVRNATIRLMIDGTYVDHTIYSNQNGAFAIDFIAPEDEGNYTLTASAKRLPYLPNTESYNIEVLNIPSFSVVFPAAAQVEQMNATDIELLIVNTGQAEITNLNISIDIENKYYSIGSYPKNLAVKQEVRIPIRFFAYNETPNTISAKMTVSSNELSQDKIFGFTILEKPPAAAITGLAVGLPDVPSEAVYLIAFATVSFTCAYVIKKRGPKTRSNPKEDNSLTDASAYLSDVKTYLNRKRE